jgi:hypothetical protein
VEEIPGIVKQSAGAGDPADVKSCELLSVGLGNIQIHGARRHDRRNGVFVDHLGDGVTQQHDVLIERFDVTLQLDAVDEVNRNRNVLFSQGVQEGVL